MFKSLVPHIEQRLKKHHELYSGQCKAELWEENCHHALVAAGFGSDWKPDFNHQSGADMRIIAGDRISNKGGQIDSESLTFSGFRTTKYKTLTDKLEFLKDKKDDYVFCLATNKNEWESGKKIYHFIVVDSNKLDYHNQEWVDTFGKKGTGKDKHNGYSCKNEVFEAKICFSMSDQLWTTIKLSECNEHYTITI
jgi:hypothetical protein